MKEVSMENLEEVSGGAGSNPIGTVLIVNCQHRCNARSGPSDKYSIIGHAYAGSKYSWYGKSGNWYLLKIDGKKMYVFKKFIQEL